MGLYLPFQNPLFFILQYAALLLLFVVIIHKFHLKNPDPKSVFFVKDEIVANRFIYAYGLASIPFVYISFIVAVVVLYFVVFSLIFIFTWGSVIFVVDFPDVILYLLPWWIDGYGIFDMIGYFLAGYHMGFYSEESDWHVYINSILVYATYSIFGHLMLIDFINYRTIEITMMIFILPLQLIIIFVGTYIGNVRSKEDRALEQFDESKVALPSIKPYLQSIYGLSLMSGMIFQIVMMSVHFANNKMNYSNFVGYISLIPIVVVLYIYATVAMMNGDVTPDEPDEIIVYIDPTTGEVEHDDEPAPIVSKLFFLIIFFSIATSIGFQISSLLI